MEQKTEPYKLKYIELLFIVSIVTIFAFATYQRNFIWKDDYSFWGDCVEKSSEKARPHNNFGSALHRKGLTDRAIYRFKKAVEIAPDMAQAYYNLGVINDEKGFLMKAAQFYKHAIELMPEYAKAISNLGIIYGKLNKIEVAIPLFEKALKIAPDDTIILLNLAVAYEESAKSVEQGADSRELIVKAIETYRKVLDLEPDNARAKDKVKMISRLLFQQNDKK